jgi:hypothetical protein
MMSRSLSGLADLVGGEWPAVAREAAKGLSGVSEDEDRGVQLLAAVRDAFNAGDQEAGGSIVLTSRRLIDLLVADEDQPWATYNRGNPVSQRQVAKLLGPYSIISETVHAAGERERQGVQARQVP